MELAGYQPTLGKIQEEPDDPDQFVDFDESILLEYAILTEHDLHKALYLDNPEGAKKSGCKCGDVLNDWCTFSAFHEKTGAKNSHLIESNTTSNSRTLRQSPSHARSGGGGGGGRVGDEHHGGGGGGGGGNLSEYSDMNSGSGSIVNIICEDQNHRVRVLKSSEYDVDSSINSLNGNDSGIHNLDSRNSSIYSSRSHTTKSLNGSINESITKSMNGSITGDSLFNLDEIVNASPHLPLDKQGIDFNTVTGRKVFIKAIRQKYMNIYYVVSQQRLSGEFIGNQSVATFIMILNSLEIRSPSGPQGDYFRTHALSDEMTFTDIASVARDNKLSAEISQVFKESCISNFRKAVKLSCKSSNILLLCHYYINNTRGQFSFVGGYFKDKDTVLILTPSKSRFLARWIPVLLMWKILLNQASADDGQPKVGCTGGYMLLQRNETNPRIAVRINKSALLCLEPPAVLNSQDFENLFRSWIRWLAQPATDITDDVILQAINHVVNNLNSQKATVQVATANVRRIVTCNPGSLSDIISRTKVYNAVKNQIDSLSSDSLKKLEVFSEWIVSMTYSSSIKNVDRKMKVMNFKKIRKKPTGSSGGRGGSSNRIIYRDNLMLAMCLVFWPYRHTTVDTNSTSLSQSVHTDLGAFPLDLMVRVQEQMRFVVTVMKYSYTDRTA